MIWYRFAGCAEDTDIGGPTTAFIRLVGARFACLNTPADPMLG